MSKPDAGMPKPQTNSYVPQKQESFDVRASLADKRKELSALLPKSLPFDRFLTVVVSACKSIPALLSCDRTSLFIAIRQAAELGLEPNSSLQHGWLVPYAGKVRFNPGYRGFIALAQRVTKLQIYGRVVYSFDKFDLRQGTDERIEHIPNLTKLGTDADIVGAYAVAKYPDSKTQFEYVSIEEIKKIRDCSQSKDSEYSPWKRFFRDMCVKTAIRRLMKYISLENQTWIRMLEVDNQDFAPIGNIERPIPETVDVKTYPQPDTLPEVRDPGQEG